MLQGFFLFIQQVKVLPVSVLGLNKLKGGKVPRILLLIVNVDDDPSQTRICEKVVQHLWHCKHHHSQIM